MQEYETAEGKSTASELDPRDRRALTEYLTVLPDEGDACGADGMYVVVSESGSTYTVDVREGACTCPDFQYRDVECKHLRRVAFATGEKAVPSDVADVDPQLGVHVDSEPVVVASDGGHNLPADFGARHGDREYLGGEDSSAGFTDSETDVDGETSIEPSGDCQCDELPDGVPCFTCYKDGAEFEMG